MAYLNGTGGSPLGKGNDAGLQMLKLLLSATRGTTQDRDPSKVKKRPEKEPDKGFKNDPDDPTNPNEARVRFIRKVDKQRNR
jgi:hypothetical protein